MQAEKCQGMVVTLSQLPPCRQAGWHPDRRSEAEREIRLWGASWFWKAAVAEGGVAVGAVTS